MADKVNWETDVRKTMEMYNKTGGKFQQEVNNLAEKMRSEAVSPLDIVEGFPDITGNGKG